MKLSEKLREADKRAEGMFPDVPNELAAWADEAEALETDRDSEERWANHYHQKAETLEQEVSALRKQLANAVKKGKKDAEYQAETARRCHVKMVEAQRQVKDCIDAMEDDSG